MVEKGPLVIPLIQHNRWLNARKPEDLENDDGDNRDTPASKVVAVGQTGDKVTDAAVREILSGKNSLSIKIKVEFTVLHSESIGGAHLPFLGLEPVGGEPLMSVTCGQYDARPTVTFPAARHPHPLAATEVRTELYCLVTETHVC